MRLRSILFTILCGVAVAGAARADTVSGADWVVRFNLPDRTTTYNSIGPDEYLIRDAFLARIDALSSNDWACLSTYTFSGNSASAGAAGPILAAMSNALVRGAKMGFVADNWVKVASNYWPGVSLTGLSTRPWNPLDLSQAPSDYGIMHDKVGVFWVHAATQAWVLSASWNFTGGASSYQWNILTEIQNNELAAAYSNEMREMLSGRFHGSTTKSHAHDGARFRLAGTARDGWVRFAPYPDASNGGSNALTDIVAAIDAATDTIVFALNKLTLLEVADALIRACDRGVVVHGTIPKSDRDSSSEDSYDAYQMLVQSTNYATANQTLMLNAYAQAKRTAYDAGESDLTHAKYMAIDPDGTNPMVIHGSANWTYSALMSASSNDENVQFIPHAGMARALVSQFNAMTDGTIPWFVLPAEAGAAQFDYWMPDTRLHELVSTENLLDPTSWTNHVQWLPAAHGFHTLSLPQDAQRQFFRIRRVP